MNKTATKRSVSKRSKRARQHRSVVGRPPLVLLVDDNPDLRDMVTTALTAIARLRVIEAPNSRIALSLARRHGPDLVISDIARPGMNGLKFLKLFKKSYPDIPVIIASGDPTGSAGEQARLLGAHAFLPKPFLLEALLEIVDEALARVGNGNSYGLAEMPLRSRLLHAV